jgi:choline dehydrogenase
VGRGLVDHVAAGVIHEVRRPITLATAKSLPNFLRWTLTGRGPLASSVAEASAFVRTREELIAPDLELLMLPVMFVDEGLSEPPGHGLTIAAINIAPLSRGSIELDAADPQGPPVIDPGYLTDDNGDDMRVLLEGVRLAREIVSARDFAKYRGAEYLPGEAAVTAESITAHVRAKAQTLYHPASTCRMGSDEGAVVDRSLRVRGIGGLRVADASIMPTLVRGHPNAAVMMIAERAADLLRDAY